MLNRPVLEDLALHLVRLRAGPTVARRTAMIALATPGRTTQAPYIDETLRENASQAFSARVRHDLLGHLDQAYALPTLAAAHHVSTRTLLRRFHAETGLTPLDFLQTARISHAKLLLESTSLSVAEIARGQLPRPEYVPAAVRQGGRHDAIAVPSLFR